jgi:hypothetical protein
MEPIGKKKLKMPKQVPPTKRRAGKNRTLGAATHKPWSEIKK